MPSLIPVGYELFAEGDDSRNFAADATGLAQIAFADVPFGQLWYIDRISVITDSAVGLFVAFKGSVDNNNIVDGTPINAANRPEIADENASVWIPGGSRFIARFTGLAALANCWVRIQYRTLQQVVTQTVDLSGSAEGIDEWLEPEPGFPNSQLDQSGIRRR